MTKIIIIDTEIFKNAFLLSGKIAGTDRYFDIWHDDEDGLERIKSLLGTEAVFVTYNGIKFDMVILGAFLAGHPPEILKMIADMLINDNAKIWHLERTFDFRRVQINHVDLMEVSPSFVSLKMYGARMHTKWITDLPIEHTAELKPEERPQVVAYCRNDLDITEQLLDALKEPLQLRIAMSKMYNVDMRSKSDTQMAEAAFVRRLDLKYGQQEIPPYVEYKLPAFIRFKSTALRSLAEQIAATKFRVHQQSGHVVMPEFLDAVIKIGNGSYQMGVGGLHSTHDKKVCYLANKEYAIVDIDAASFYPSIMILCDLIPQNTGKRFIEEYKEIYYKRLEAKKNGDKAVANTLKISLNGTFGKTADRFSPLYSPDLMINITITGQLTLLCMIERFVEAGFEICSANTDGIGIRYKRTDQELLEKIVTDFSKESGFEFEYTNYRVLAMKDVNNYIAITTDKKPKARGIYAPPDLRKNPTASICVRAVTEWLLTGRDFEDTVRSGKLIEFLSARNVTGGAKQGDKYIGKVVRWYHSTDKNVPPLLYKKNDYKVATSEGCRALMKIDDYDKLPDDLDLLWYVRESIRIAGDIGCDSYLTEEQKLMLPTKTKRKRKNDEQS